MRRRYVLLCFSAILLILQSCDDPLDNNRRIIVHGKVVDENGTPIKNMDIKVSSREIDLGSGISTGDGSFEFASLETRLDDFVITINPENEDDSAYSSVRFESVVKNSLRQEINTYAMGEIRLRRAATLNLNVTSASAQSDTLHWRVRYPQAFCGYTFNKTPSNAEEMLCYPENVFQYRQTPARPNDQIEIRSLLGENAVFNYSINSGAEEEIIIPLNNPQNSFTFEY